MHDDGKSQLFSISGQLLDCARGAMSEMKVLPFMDFFHMKTLEVVAAESFGCGACEFGGKGQHQGCIEPSIGEKFKFVLRRSDQRRSAARAKNMCRMRIERDGHGSGANFSGSSAHFF